MVWRLPCWFLGRPFPPRPQSWTRGPARTSTRIYKWECKEALYHFPKVRITRGNTGKTLNIVRVVYLKSCLWCEGCPVHFPSASSFPGHRVEPAGRQKLPWSLSAVFRPTEGRAQGFIFGHHSEHCPLNELFFFTIYELPLWDFVFIGCLKSCFWMKMEKKFPGAFYRESDRPKAEQRQPFSDTKSTTLPSMKYQIFWFLPYLILVEIYKNSPLMCAGSLRWYLT